MDWSAVSNADRDSLHTLPLAILPIETPALAWARLVKNVHLEGMVEIFADLDTGSGLLPVEGLAQEFGWPDGETGPPHPDLVLMRKLANLHSYDVYSLRISLRQQGIEVNDVSALTLSDQKISELTEYMNAFTRPLLLSIYGDDDTSVENFADILSLFRDPDVARARQKLQRLADRLEIKLTQIPGFLEDYGDIFLSLSYYRQCLDEIQPVLEDFQDALQDLSDNWQLKTDKNLMDACAVMTETCRRVVAWVEGRLEQFDESGASLWRDASANSFGHIERLEHI